MVLRSSEDSTAVFYGFRLNEGGLSHHSQESRTTASSDVVNIINMSPAREHLSSNRGICCLTAMSQSCDVRGSWTQQKHRLHTCLMCLDILNFRYMFIPAHLVNCHVVVRA